METGIWSVKEKITDGSQWEAAGMTLRLSTSEAILVPLGASLPQAWDVQVFWSRMAE